MLILWLYTLNTTTCTNVHILRNWVNIIVVVRWWLRGPVAQVHSSLTSQRKYTLLLAYMVHNLPCLGKYVKNPECSPRRGTEVWKWFQNAVSIYEIELCKPFVGLIFGCWMSSLGAACGRGEAHAVRLVASDDRRLRARCHSYNHTLNTIKKHVVIITILIKV